MSRIFALSLMALSFGFMGSVHADEGKSADAVPALDAQRTSNYVRAPRSTLESVPAAKNVRSKPHANQKTSAKRSPRAAMQAQSSRASYFHIYDATSTLRADRDRDGYHSEFRVRFDADAEFPDALVYARLYLRRVGESEWLLYQETDDFHIYGESDDDDYYVTTLLDAGYATGEYDVLIDLYESGYSGIVATLGPEDVDLGYLPLEEVGLDAPIGIAGYSILGVTTDLIVDADGDDYFSTFRITFDPDADTDSRLVYARIWVRARGGEWIEEYATEDWYVETSGDDDSYVLDVDWLTGYPTSYYDVQIDLHDSATDLLVASAGSDRLDLAQIPLEDRSRDRAASAPTQPAPGDSSSREGGGGAVELWMLLVLVLLIAARWVVRKNRRVPATRNRSNREKRR